MKYQIARHPKVRDDLLSIARLIGNYAGWDIARTKIERIEHRFSLLSETPYVGSIRDDVHPTLRVLPVIEKGVLCFTVDRDTCEVLIVCVTYAGADWASRVKYRL